MSTYMLVRHTVKDFTGWKRVYDGHIGKRNEAGLTEQYLLRGLYSVNEVILLFEVKDIERARKFTESTDLRDRMMEAGVIGKPDIYFLTEEKAAVYPKASGF